MLNKNVKHAFEVIINCTELFYKNDYPIIGIENMNTGGLIFFAEAFHQLLQIKTLNRLYFSGRNSNIYKKGMERILKNYINVET